jgi:hypothetical protein
VCSRQKPVKSVRVDKRVFAPPRLKFLQKRESPKDSLFYDIFILLVVSWVSGESVGLREAVVGFTPVYNIYGKEQTGKQAVFRETLSTNHVVQLEEQCESRSVGFWEGQR